MTPEKFENLGFRGGEGADKPQVIGKSKAVEKEASDKAQGFLAVRSQPRRHSVDRVWLICWPPCARQGWPASRCSVLLTGVVVVVAG